VSLVLGAAVAAVLGCPAASPPQHPLAPTTVSRRARNPYAQLRFFISASLSLQVPAPHLQAPPGVLRAIIHPQRPGRR
jgi:hypothetical protein